MSNLPFLSRSACALAIAAVGAFAVASAQAATLIDVSNVVTFDSFLSGDAPRNVLPGYTVSSSVTSPLLVFAIASEGNDDYTVSGVTYGPEGSSQSFVSAEEFLVQDGGDDGYVGLFYLTNPVTDTAYDITVNSSNTSSKNVLYAAFTLSNIDQLDPLGVTTTFGNIDNTDGGANNPSTTLTAEAADSLLVSASMDGNGGKYSVASPGEAIVGLSGGKSGLGLTIGGWDGGTAGSATSLGFDGSVTTRVAIASAEFKQSGGEIPEPASAALMGLAGALVLGGRRRRA